MNDIKTDVDVVYEKMNDEKLRFTDNLVDEIVDFFDYHEYGVSETDVVDVAIYTLYSIVVIGEKVSPIIKKELNDIIGDANETIAYFGDALSCISATDDAIADEVYEKEFCSNPANNDKIAGVPIDEVNI